MRQLTGYFFRGLIYMAPLAVTIYIAHYVITGLDSIFHFEIPGVSLLIVLMLITMLGFIGSFFITSPAFQFFENLLKKTPLVSIVYTSVKDLVNAFAGDKNKFNKPVLVKLDKNVEAYMPGFITDESLGKFGEPGLVAVYLPLSYAFSGRVYIVPKENIKRVNASPVEFMKFIVSGGVSGNVD